MKRILFALAALVAFAACDTAPDTICVIPQPNEVHLTRGSIDLTSLNVKISDDLDEASRNYVEAYAATENVSENGADVVFALDKTLGYEAYTMDITAKAVTVKASSLNGFVYGVQTLRQLLEADRTVECMQIKDEPRFHYRGMHMDCSRHFFSTDEVKKYLDIMELHKLNTLHWHLTDDQGWRIEIEKYPLLTQVGAWRSGTLIGKGPECDDIRYGGYYTKAELEEIVAYAAAKGITIVPEIDLPGHMQAAIAAYPELGCTGGPYEVWKIWGVSDDVLCVGKEETFGFIEDVLTEVMAIFPSEYIHIGGDECPKSRWHECPRCQAKIQELGLPTDGEFPAENYLQSYVTARVEKFLADHGRKMIGWDEILEGEVSENATIMSWRGAAGGIKAANMGHDAIMTPNSYLYFDYYQFADTDNEPLAIGGCLPVRRVYSYEPYDDSMTEENRGHVIGVQANLWTEYIATPEYLEYMLLPRLSALSEVQWCKPERKDYDAFKANMENMRKFYDKGGYNYATHIFDFDDSVAEDNAISHKARGKEATLNSTPHLNYKFHAPDELFDGLFGDMSFVSGKWIGFEGENLDVTIKMNKEPFTSVTIETLVDKGGYIFDATWMKVYTSSNGTDFTLLSEDEYECDGEDDPDGIRRHTIEVPQTKAKYIKVVAGTIPVLPDWHPGAGAKTFLFVDEVIVD